MRAPFLPGISAELQVWEQTVNAAFATVPRFLVAAEWRGGVEAVERVGPDHARAHALRHPEDSRSFVGPNAGGEPVRSVVGLLDGLRGGAEREYREHRPEDLLAGDAVRLGDVGKQSGRDTE